MIPQKAGISARPLPQHRLFMSQKFDSIKSNKRNFHKKAIVAKASGGQWYPLPLSLFMLESGSERGSGLKGAADVCLARIQASRKDMILELEI